jgi:hypothetical protein
MIKSIRSLFVATTLALSLTTLVGCAAVLPLIPKIVSVITDAVLILDTIDTTVQEVFRQNPDIPDRTRAKYTIVMTKAQQALNSAQHTLQGTQDLDQKQYDAAFAEFKQAYTELLALLEKEGLMQNNMLGSGEGAVQIPQPEALTYKVE